MPFERIDRTWKCPGGSSNKKCNASFDTVANLMQHMSFKHNVRKRFIVIDREKEALFLTDKEGIKVSELPEPPMLEATAAA